MHVRSLPTWFMIFLVFVCMRTQLWFQRMDHEADENVGKRTTAIMLGRDRTRLAICSFLFAEGMICHWGSLTVGVVWCSYCFTVFAAEKWLSKAMTCVLMLL